MEEVRQIHVRNAETLGVIGRRKVVGAVEMGTLAGRTWRAERHYWHRHGCQAGRSSHDGTRHGYRLVVRVLAGSRPQGRTERDQRIERCYEASVVPDETRRFCGRLQRERGRSNDSCTSSRGPSRSTTMLLSGRKRSKEANSKMQRLSNLREQCRTQFEAAQEELANARLQLAKLEEASKGDAAHASVDRTRFESCQCSWCHLTPATSNTTECVKKSPALGTGVTWVQCAHRNTQFLCLESNDVAKFVLAAGTERPRELRHPGWEVNL